MISPTGWLVIALRLAAMLGWLGLCVVLYYLCGWARQQNPWPRIFLGGIAWIAGVDIAVAGTPARRGAVLLANHVSWIDIPAMAATSGTAFVAHDGLAAVPVLRWLCRMNDTVFVARHDRASVAAQVAQVREALIGSPEGSGRGSGRAAGALAIFPEGMTNDGRSLHPFKSSLLSAFDPLPPGITVQPLWLDYGAEAAGIAWIGEEHGLDNFLRILARWRPLTLTVHFLAPLTGDALANRKTMAAAAREAILEAMCARGAARSP